MKVLNIRNRTGTVACTLFESPGGFHTEFLRSATNVTIMKIRKAQASCDFEDIPPGTYAIAVVHDENMDGKLETDWMGMPTEGYGFLNHANAGIARLRFPTPAFRTTGST